uniref:Uncharacterized protein n=1 Tax=Myotis myotis TaxID=51298 RepID=A0A7J7VZG3_MYOMY|nr:hypothetical protein mMyoMyo1_012371 [Myotis myotis]
MRRPLPPPCWAGAGNRSWEESGVPSLGKVINTNDIGITTRSVISPAQVFSVFKIPCASRTRREKTIPNVSLGPPQGAGRKRLRGDTEETDAPAPASSPAREAVATVGTGCASPGLPVCPGPRLYIVKLTGILVGARVSGTRCRRSTPSFLRPIPISGSCHGSRTTIVCEANDAFRRKPLSFR